MATWNAPALAAYVLNLQNIIDITEYAYSTAEEINAAKDVLITERNKVLHTLVTALKGQQ